MPRARLIARAATLAIVCGVTASVTLGSAAAAPHPSARTATVRAGGDASVAPTSTTQGFLGLATSFSTLPVLSGSASDPDLAFRNLVRNLSPGAPFQLRLGGVSADDSWWPTPAIKTPPYLGRLTPRMLRDIDSLLSAVGGRVILGLNLEEPPSVDTPLVKAEAAAFERYIGADRIDAFELGNEPEYWPLSSSVNGGRGRDTIPAYGRKASAIAAQLGDVPLAGPAAVGTVWLSKLSTILGELPAHLTAATVHIYPLKNCSRAAHPLLSQLLARSSVDGLGETVHGMVKAARAHGEPLRVDELNAITCGGKAGMSNSFGEALWALNALPALWRAGVQGVNFQTVDGGLNQAITAHHSASGWRVSVEPVYYGLLAFARAAPAGSHLLRVTGPRIGDLYEFAVRAPDGSERVVLTNVGSATHTIAVSAAGTHGAGSVSLLTARSLSATGGTTLGGQTLSARTGLLAGRMRVTRVRRGAQGAYSVRVPAHSAAILTLGR